MAWPSAQDYNEAIQNPHQNFADPELQAGAVELTPLGLPRPITGGFATVYKVETGGRVWAVRCFLREILDQQKRYEAISKSLTAARLPYTVGFGYQEQGVRIRGKWFPLLKMEWVPGEPLNTYIETHLHDSARLLDLANRWARMAATLQRNGLAHGDLQHGNVLVVHNDFKLIDYDGMYVPALAGQTSHETGHRNYQLPQRSSKDFGPYLDNFSVWVVYLSLVALSLDPTLWQQAKAGDENLLFRKEDFDAQQSSAALALLSQHANPRLQHLARLFEPLLCLPPARVPPLDPGALAITSPARTAAPGFADWLRDHLPLFAKEPAPAPAPPPAPSSSAPEWLRDHLPVPPKPKRFQGSTLPARLGVLLGLLGLFLPFTVSVSALTLTTRAFSLALLGLLETLLLLTLFLNDPTVRERKPLLARRKQEQQALIALEITLQASEAQVAALQGEETRAQKALDAERAALDQKRQQERDRLETQIQARFDALSKRLQKVEAPLLKFRQEGQGRIAQLQQQLAWVQKAEMDDLTSTLQEIQDKHVRDFLKRRYIATAGLVGPMVAARLVTSGFIHAGHITPDIMNVPSVDATQATALLDWRRRMEQEAHATMPTALSRTQENMVLLRYENSKLRLKQQVDAATQTFHEQEKAFLTRIAVPVQQLGQERQTLETQAEQERRSLDAQQAQERQQLADKVKRAKKEFADRRKRLNAAIAQALTDIAHQNERIGQVERELELFHTITLSGYLQRTLLWKQGANHGKRGEHGENN